MKSKLNDHNIIRSVKFDMLRINQLTNSPLASPMMQGTNKLK